MTTFNFTVRATDDAGAFADRNFAITVNNTKIENFVAINGTDAYSSSNGISWTIRPGAGGYQVRWGAGQWVVLIQDGSFGGSNTYRTSPDGINFTTRTFPTEMNPYAFYSYEINKWVVTSRAMYPSNAYVYTSVDLINWVAGGIIFTQNLLNDLYAGPMSIGNNAWFVSAQSQGNFIGWKSTDNGASWSIIYPPYVAPYFAKDVKYINGVWILTNYNDNNIYTSIDLTTWVPNIWTITDTNSAYGFQETYGASGRIAYGNGRLVIGLYGYNTGVPAGYNYSLVSVDAKNFTANPIPNLALAGVVAPSFIDHNYSVVTDVVYAQGTFVMVKSATTEVGVLSQYISPYILYSYDGVSWGQITMPDPYSIVSIASTSEV